MASAKLKAVTTSSTPARRRPSLEEVKKARGLVRREFERFSKALPVLLQDPQLQGRWVVFLGGEVKHSAADEMTAHRWALDHLDRLSGFVVADVSPPRVYKIGGALRR